MNVTRNDMALQSRLFPCGRAEDLPISFALDGVPFRGFPADWHPVVSRRQADANLLLITVTAREPHGLEFRLEQTVYRDYPVVEWVLFITNHGTGNSPRVSDLRVLDGVIPGGDPHLYHGNGDNVTEEGYTFVTEKLTADPIVKFPTPHDGNSCFGASPYMRLRFDTYAVNLAVGWTGSWESRISAEGDGARVVIGQRTFDAYLKPGETVRTPSVTLLAADGAGDDRIRNLWRRFYYDHVLPRENGQKLPSKLILHTWRIDGKSEFCGCTEDNQRAAVDRYMKMGVKPDIWWLDAGWYPCHDDWGCGTGNFFCNPDNFPNGLGAVGDMCHERGIQFLLWFEPERICNDTWVAEHKPEFLWPYDDGSGWFQFNHLFRLGDRAACDWLIDTVDGLIKEYHVDIYRQDFNFQPLPIWTANDEPGRAGMCENQHIQGYYRYWDALVERNPGLLIDSCSSGGKRNDMESMRRAVPFHYTDIGYGKHPVKQGQYRHMFEWIPYFRSHTMAWDRPDGTYGSENRPVDEFSFLTVMTAPAVTVMTDYDADEADFAVCRRLVPVWRETADISLASDYYPLTECRRSDGDWYAAQFDDDTRGRGVLHFIRNIACEEESITVHPHVAPENREKTYVLADRFTGETLRLTGQELADGFTYAAPRRSGTVFVYQIES